MDGREASLGGRGLAMARASLRSTCPAAASPNEDGCWLYRSADKHSKSRLITSDVGAPVCERRASQVW
jgi:hypothetical protein